MCILLLSSRLRKFLPVMQIWRRWIVGFSINPIAILGNVCPGSADPCVYMFCNKDFRHMFKQWQWNQRNEWFWSTRDFFVNPRTSRKYATNRKRCNSRKTGWAAKRIQINLYKTLIKTIYNQYYVSLWLLHDAETIKNNNNIMQNQKLDTLQALPSKFSRNLYKTI